MKNNDVAIMVEIAGKKLRLWLPGDGWTSDEAKLAKQVSEGMAPVEIEDRLMLMDPDAWIAVLRVSYMHANEEYPVGAIANLNLLDLMETVADAIKEARKDSPPTSVSANGSSSSDALSENEQPQGSSSETTTSEISGHPA